MQKYKVTVDTTGTIRFYTPGTDELHRIGGPAVEYANIDKSWYQNGELHRIDGPAVENSDGYKAWYQNDQRHRTDGPAVEYANSSTVEYWINGKELTEEEFKKKTAPVKEMTIAEIEAKLGHKVKIVK